MSTFSRNTAFANREVCDLIVYDYETKKPYMNFAYANTSATEVTGETVFAYGGKGHPKRVAFNGEKGGTFTFETQLQTMQLYALISGGEISDKATFVKREELTALNSGLTLSETPAENTEVFVYSVDDDCGAEIKTTVTDKAVVAAEGATITSGEKYVAYYMVDLTGVQKIAIKSTTFPKAVTIYADTFEKTEDDEVLPYKMVAYKCAPQSTFNLSQSNNGDPVTLTVTFDLMADSDNNLIDMILEEDATVTE